MVRCGNKSYFNINTTKSQDERPLVLPLDSLHTQVFVCVCVVFMLLFVMLFMWG
eukprot:m.29530 g.29530  ORF g.29530 m.29530 type:complete len:54 (+) comp9584_c0_seq8:2589-2750(+)